MYEQDLSRLDIFQGLTEEQLNMLKPMVNPCQFPQGMVIFEQGESASALYILLTGEVSVEYKPYDGPTLTVARINPGGIFGWSAALGRKNYTSAAISLVDSLAICITNQNLHLICEKDPLTGGILIERLASVIAERLRSTHSEIFSILSQGMDLNENSVKRNVQDEQ